VGAIEERGVETAKVEVRHLHALAEYEACIELQKRVWGGAEIDLVPLPIFVVAAEVGGQVLGAYAGEEIVGFTLAVPGVRDGRPFLHSHMTAVIPELQNRGIGRMLKLKQREDALERGIELVEWTFDPLEIRNAWFNIERLGAIVRRFLPNCYGVTSSPLHAGLPTDRVVAEWWLRSPRVEGILRGTTARAADPRIRITVPKAIVEWRRTNPSEAARVQTRIREEFQSWFGRNFAVTGFEVTAEGGSYLLEPYEGAKSLSA